MEKSFDLAEYLNEGIADLVRGILRASVKNPAAASFCARYALAAKRAEARRRAAAESGTHVPSFLIASVTGQCNLHCAGCYDRANNAARCGGESEMSRADWARVFDEAVELGVSVILLAGGEPLLRPDVLEEAAARPQLLFPVFTNGTLLDEAALARLRRHRNLLPVISIEGDSAVTDARRGEGMHARVLSAMRRMAESGLLFGASITVTAENLLDVASGDYLAALAALGCKAAVYVEYVPVADGLPALDDAGRAALADSVAALREESDLLIISFPGDETASGGCLAAGRGFFHISATGAAEPCPFSPYADTSLKTVSLRDALASPLFERLQADGLLALPHTGGCALFAQAGQVQALAAAGQRDGS